jgi:hypothetical protein
MFEWEEPREPFRPRYGGIVSCEDPDTGEEVGAPSLEGRTLLATEMLETVRPQRPEFRTHREATAWYRLETAVPPGIEANMWHDWIRNRLWCAQKFHMSYQKLMSAIKNEDKFRDWRARQNGQH